MVLLDGNRQNEEMNASKPMRNKRGKYSKVGCGECKKMKIKCDEARPVCRRCLRLGKHCEYRLSTRTQGSAGITGSRAGHYIDKSRKIQDMNCYNPYALSKKIWLLMAIPTQSQPVLHMKDIWQIMEFLKRGSVNLQF